MQEIHPFAIEALSHAVNAALQTAPPEHDGASVSVSTAEGVKVVLAHRLNDHWSVIAAASHPASGKGTLDYGVSVNGSWTW